MTVAENVQSPVWTGLLPTNHEDADSTVCHSRYAMLDGDVFYRGIADAADDGKALIFATRQQLEMLQSSTEVFFDATFKVVPSLYYQMLTIFASQWRLFRADTCASAAHAQMLLQRWTAGVHCAIAPSEWFCVCTISALFVNCLHIL